MILIQDVLNIFMTYSFCPGRQTFENFVIYVSEKNTCPLGLGIACDICRYHLVGEANE